MSEIEKLNIGVYQSMCGINEEKTKKTENCRGCIYHGEHQDMGATIEVCNREEDLGKAVAACENSANCGIKLTLADVEKLKAERDAAVSEIEHNCYHCKYSKLYRYLGIDYNDCEFYKFGKCKEREKWEWRGVQNG